MILKVIFLSLVIISGALSIILINENSGFITLSWSDYQISMPLLLFLCGLLVVYSVVKSFFFLLKIPNKMMCRWRNKNASKVPVLLLRFLESYGAEDSMELVRQGKKLARALGDNNLRLFSEGVAHFFQGHFTSAQSVFEGLSGIKDFFLLGKVMLIHLYERKKQKEDVLKVAKQILSVAPSYAFALKKAFESAFVLHHYEEALEFLGKLKNCRDHSDPEILQKKAVTYLALSQREKERGQEKEGFEYGKKAYDCNPNNPEILRNLVPYLIARGDSKKAQAFIEKAWEQVENARSSQLAQLYLQSHGSLTTLQEYQKVQRLVSFALPCYESDLESARYAVKAKLWGQARAHLSSLEQDGQYSGDVFFLKAEIERSENPKSIKVEEYYRQAINLFSKSHK